MSKELSIGIYLWVEAMQNMGLVRSVVLSSFNFPEHLEFKMWNLAFFF